MALAAYQALDYHVLVKSACSNIKTITVTQTRQIGLLVLLCVNILSTFKNATFLSCHFCVMDNIRTKSSCKFMSGYCIFMFRHKISSPVLLLHWKIIQVCNSRFVCARIMQTLKNVWSMLLSSL